VRKTAGKNKQYDKKLTQKAENNKKETKYKELLHCRRG
jgi:hypothetical protein